MPHVASGQFLLFPPARPLAERFGPEFFRAVPEAPGVYFMSAPGDGVLYVGKARNLRRRLASYRSGSGERLPKRLVRLLLRVERIDWDICPDEASALERERLLIRQLQPRFNSAGVRPPKDWFIHWHHHTHTITLALSSSTQPPPPCPAPTPARIDTDTNTGTESSDAIPSVWPHERGPLPYAPATFAALLRSLWSTLHPDRSIAHCPPPLLAQQPPQLWSFPAAPAALAWLNLLPAFLDGLPSPWVPAPPATDSTTDSALTHPAPEPVPADVPPGSGPSFDQQWLALDRETLAQFHARRPNARLCSSLPHNLAELPTPGLVPGAPGTTEPAEAPPA